jgi:hypothetical protein
MRDIDQEITEILRLSQGLANRLPRGRGRSIRPGRNHLRRMSTGTLVREHRRQVINDRLTRSDKAIPGAGLVALGAEFLRRGLSGAALAIENRERSDIANTPGGREAKAAIEQAQQRPGASEDFEGARLESIVNARVDELGGADQPVVTERETTALTSAELTEDFEEVEASAETQESAVFTGEVNGEDPQEGLEVAATAHPETLEFEPITAEQLDQWAEAAF